VTGALLLAIVLAASPSTDGMLAKAQQLYEQAQAEKDPAAQVSLLERSIAAQPTFEAHLALGDALLAQKKYAEAREALKHALDLAGTEKARARATYVVAETFLAEGQRRDALLLFRQSIRHHPYPNVIARLKELELASLGSPVSAGEIAGALTSSATRSFSVAASSSIDLRIGFALNSAELDGAGLAQARELGKALLAPELADKDFEIVGHTDTQGDAAYNDRLSLRRAESVRAFLVKELQVPARRLTAVGRGEREPLYPGDTESDHALNRRVEVRAR
jgi:OOP family OmpA-OmpF porin